MSPGLAGVLLGLSEMHKLAHAQSEVNAEGSGQVDCLNSDYLMTHFPDRSMLS